MTDHSTEIATTLAKLASLLADQQDPEPEPTPPKPRASPERELLTVEEAAQQLGVGRTKTFALVRSGDLESVRIGRLRRVPKSAIDHYATQLIAQQCPQPDAA